MTLYKKFACENLAQINQQILSYIDSLELDYEAFWNPIDTIAFVKNTPLLQYWLIKNGLPIKRLAVTTGTHARCCEPHTDTPPSIYKLSWPLLNTEHTWNRWFEPTDQCRYVINALGGTSYLDQDQLNEIGRMRVDSPAIIYTGIPHDVWFESDAVYPRLGLQCQLFLEPQSL